MGKKEKTIIIVAAGDLLSTVIKFVLATVTGSLSLLADAWHSLGDLATSLTVLISLFLDRREAARKIEEPDKPVIIRRAGWELRATAVIGILLIIVAAGVLKKTISGTGLAGIRAPGIAALIVIVLIIISTIRFKFESSVGKETGSSALIADAYHSKVDVFVLSMVLVSLGGEMLKLPLDRWAAMIIGMMILGIGLRIVTRAVGVFLKASRQTEPDKRSIEENLVMILAGRLSIHKEWFQKRLVDRLKWSDKRIRRRLLRNISIGIGLAVSCGYIGTGFYSVGPAEVAVCERFGCPVDPENPVGPGLHYYFPQPIGNIRKVDIGGIRRTSFGYQSILQKDFILWTNVHYLREHAILTGDSTFLDVAANIHYRIRSPSDYLYQTADPEQLLETIAYGVLQETVGQREFFDILTFWRRPFEDRVTEAVQCRADQLKLGMEILRIYFRDIHPPVDVAASFEDVVSAQEDQETYIQEAEGYRRELIPNAAGEKAVLMENARAQRTRISMIAAGKSHAFELMEQSFQHFRDVNIFRLKMETLETILAGVSKYIVDREVSKQPIDMFLNPSRNSRETVIPLVSDGLGGQP
ncbi:protease modulator HflK family protein [bacterium]|nr:protease modulator HflK family protein [candidate division CSSED10-310 bacterium]